MVLDRRSQIRVARVDKEIGSLDCPAWEADWKIERGSFYILALAEHLCKEKENHLLGLPCAYLSLYYSLKSKRPFAINGIKGPAAFRERRGNENCFSLAAFLNEVYPNRSLPPHAFY